MTTISALRVKQWLQEWETIKWNEDLHQSRPLEHFYVLSMSANQLRKLSGVYRREAQPGKARTTDSGPQRFHDAARSHEISRFIKFGFPWSDLGPKQREQEEFADLQKPGWLPTSIVVNILHPGNTRDGKTLVDADAISIEDHPNHSVLTLPDSSESFDVPPIEVIDGQHRLWAFDDGEAPDDFELPVIAFHGLDRSWQAYLFWTINIKPKRINPSLAYDLYPLLRGEDWLEKSAGHSIYRETRAQEIVESLWTHSDSPWMGRINMLGEKGSRKATITQAAWIRSLMATFLRAWQSTEERIGGLFGAPRGKDTTTLEWGRPLQSALLIFIWNSLAAQFQLRFPEEPELFSESRRLITSDQGVRAVLFTYNDILVEANQALKLESLTSSPHSEPVDDSEIAEALLSISEHSGLVTIINDLARAIVAFDWLPFDYENLSPPQQRQKAGYRGSGGYKLLRQDLMDHVSESSDSNLKAIAREIRKRHGA